MMRNRGYWRSYRFAAVIVMLALAIGIAGGRAHACTGCTPTDCEVCTEWYPILIGDPDYNFIPSIGEVVEDRTYVEWSITKENGLRRLTFDYGTDPTDNAGTPRRVCWLETAIASGSLVSENNETINATVAMTPEPANDSTIFGVDDSVIPLASVHYYSREGLNEWNWYDANSEMARGPESTFETTITANYDYAPGDETHVTFREVKRGTTTLSRTHFKYNLDGTGKLVRLRKTVVGPQLDGNSYLTTLYAYYDSSCEDPNNVGKLWFVVEPEGVARYLGTAGYGKGINPNNPGGPCSLDTSGDTSNASLKEYAAREYTSYNAAGRITSMTGSGCRGCGGAGGEGSYSFVYDTNDNYDANTMNGRENGWKEYRGTQMPDGHRKVEFINADKQVVYNVEQEMSGSTIQKVWITHYVYYHEGTKKIGKIKERRMPSACEGAEYGYSQSGGWVTDVDPNDAGTQGLVHVYDYDSTSGKLSSEKVRQGTKDTGNSKYWIRKLTYGTNTGTVQGFSVTVHPLTNERTYPEQTENENDPNALDTGYAHDYYPGTNAVRIRTVTYPKVTEARNGSDANTSVAYHYFRDANSSVELYYNDWTRHEDGRYSYTELGTDLHNWGQVATSIEDANGTPPGTWTAKTDGLNLTTSYAYYSAVGSFGRLKSVLSPNDANMVYAYVHQEVTQDGNTTTTRLVTLTTPHMDGDGDYDYAPVRISVSDLEGRTVISADGNSTNWTDGDLAGDWTAATEGIAAFNGAITAKSVNDYNKDGQLTSSDSYYVVSATPANEKKITTTYYYDSINGRQYMTQAPDGTFTWTGFDGLGRAVTTYVGTQVGSADQDGYGTLVQVSATEYDNGGVGDGLVTKTKSFRDADNSYDTTYKYDYRGRRTGTLGPDDVATAITLDNLGRAIITEVFKDADANCVRDSGEDYLSVATSDYDERGQVWRSRSYKIVDGDITSSGNLAASVRLTTKYWYDERGRRIKSANPNALFSKQAYDGAGRVTAGYVCYDTGDTTYADANDVLGDIVIEQTKQDYDDAGNVWLARHFRRFDGLSGTGELHDPSGADPNALVTYTVSWFDDLGRTTTTAFYGTNGNTVITTLPSEPAPNSSDNYIVTQYEYDANTGRVAWTKDNKARKTVRQYDALGRTTKVIENYDDGDPTTGAADKDRTTTYTFDAKGRQALITAKAQSGGDDQKTYYFFCDTDNDATNNNLASGGIVTAVAYPDTTDTVTDNSATTGLWNLGSGTDHVSYAYDRLGRKTGATDQRQVVHAYAFSTTTGALLSDTVTFPGTLPASLDNTIKKIGYTYDDFGRTTKVTSYSDTGTTKANEVAFEYGPWGAVTKSMQDHAAAATDTDPNVQYAYEDGTDGVEAKFLRPDYVTYPGPSSRRVVYYNYATSGVGAALGRLDDIADDQGDQSGRTRYAAYGYLGAGTMVKVQYPAVTDTLTLTYGTRQDRYVALDRFGRVLWQRWTRGSTVADAYFYGYDRAGNRKWRAERSNSFLATGKRDEAYVYDGLDRLVGAKRGILPSGAYQAPYPGDATLNGKVDFFDLAICGSYGTGKIWTQGEFDGDGVVDDVDEGNVMYNWNRGGVAASVARSWSWTLDPLGNWSQYKWDADGDGGGAELTQDRAHNTANEIAGNSGNPISGTGAANWVDPTYDPAGNMISGPQPRFETVDANTQLYKYDAWNRLTKIYRDADSDDTIDDPSELVVTYSYDGQNRRIRKVVEAGESDITYDYYYNESWQVLEVRKGADPDAYQQYVWGANYIDAPVVSFLDGNLDGDVADQGDSTLYYTYDGNFNVTAVIKPDGTVAERYTYDPYGKVTFKAANWSDAANQAKSAYDNEILYCGYRFDPESGNYIVRNRYLTPPLGRWLTNDPIGYGDGMNMYQYVRSAPIMHRDPFGLESSGQRQARLTRPATAILAVNPALPALQRIGQEFAAAPKILYASGLTLATRKLENVSANFDHYLNAAPADAEASFFTYSGYGEFRWKATVPPVDAFHETIHALHYTVRELGVKPPDVIFGSAMWPSYRRNPAERLAWAAMLLYQNQFNLTPIEEAIRKRRPLHEIAGIWDHQWGVLDSNLRGADFDGGAGQLVDEDYQRVFTLLSYRLSCREIREELVRAYHHVPIQCLRCPRGLPSFLR